MTTHESDAQTAEKLNIPLADYHRVIAPVEPLTTSEFYGHTPGPWGIETTSGTLWIGPMRKEGGKIAVIVTEIDFCHDYKPEAIANRKANAKLIAAATALLTERDHLRQRVRELEAVLQDALMVFEHRDLLQGLTIGELFPNKHAACKSALERKEP